MRGLITSVISTNLIQQSNITLINSLNCVSCRNLLNCLLFSKYSKFPAYLNIVDIAGLVKGAHEGQGLGNAFLSHIRSVDAIFHLCREC